MYTAMANGSFGCAQDDGRGWRMCRWACFPLLLVMHRWRISIRCFGGPFPKEVLAPPAKHSKKNARNAFSSGLMDPPCSEIKSSRNEKSFLLLFLIGDQEIRAAPYIASWCSLAICSTSSTERWVDSVMSFMGALFFRRVTRRTG